MTVTSLYNPPLPKILFHRLSLGTGFEYHQFHDFTPIAPISMEYYVSFGLSDTRINMSGNSPFQRARVQVCVARARGEPPVQEANLALTSSHFSSDPGPPHPIQPGYPAPAN